MKKHILSIDDEADIRELLREILSLKGYRVSTAADPESAKRTIQEDSPQLIIVDFQIEQGDGFEMIEDIKKLAPNTPIMLLTGAVFNRGQVRDMIEKKVACHLDKSSPLSTIVCEIGRLLSK